MQNIDIKLKPSRCFLWLLAVVWFIGNILIFCTNMSFIIKVILWIAMLFYWQYILKLHGTLQNKKSITSLQLRDKQWFVNHYPVSVLGDSTITQFISVLRFKCNVTKRVFVSVILPDSLEMISYSQLVMRLRTIIVEA